MKNSAFSKMQKFFSISKHELTFVLILFGGLALASLVHISSDYDSNLSPAKISAIHKTLDSLADTSTVENVQKKSIENSATNTSNRKPAKRNNITTGSININTASKSELMTLPRIGPIMAERIIEFRKEHKFSSSEDLLYIKGIGNKTLDKLKPYIVCK